MPHLYYTGLVLDPCKYREPILGQSMVNISGAGFHAFHSGVLRWGKEEWLPDCLGTSPLQVVLLTTKFLEGEILGYL
jgi:hypothetical protein